MTSPGYRLRTRSPRSSASTRTTSASASRSSTIAAPRSKLPDSNDGFLSRGRYARYQPPPPPPPKPPPPPPLKHPPQPPPPPPHDPPPPAAARRPRSARQRDPGAESPAVEGGADIGAGQIAT